jgi:hypothetical protein
MKFKFLSKIVVFLRAKWNRILPVFLIGALLVGYYFFDKYQENNKQIEAEEAKKEEGQTIISSNALFQAKVEQIRERTIVKIRYQPPKNPTPIYLSFEPDEGLERPVITVMHPIFDSLNWPSVSNTQYTLFQREKIFDSVESFLGNPPQESYIITDPALLDKKIIRSDKVAELQDNLSIEGTDYILTTYHKPFEEDGWMVYEALVDATNAYVGDGKMTWMMSMPNISEENPLRLNGIDITFNLPANTVIK